MMLNALVREMMQWWLPGKGLSRAKPIELNKSWKTQLKIFINVSAQNMNYFLGGSQVEPKYSHRSLMMLRIASECNLIDP